MATAFLARDLEMESPFVCLLFPLALESEDEPFKLARRFIQFAKGRRREWLSNHLLAPGMMDLVVMVAVPEGVMIEGWTYREAALSLQRLPWP
jgi:hypothetical protein